MKHIQQNFNNYLPWRDHYNPLIILSNKEHPLDEKAKNKSVQKNRPLKKDSLYIILADDDEDDRELFSEVIDETGLNVKLDYAEDGKELLKMLNSASRELPHMIFLDLNMPNKGGKECLDAIRASEYLKNIPVIIYSTSSSHNDIEETFEKGANLYVRKPTSYKELLNMARMVLSLNWENYKPRASKTNFVFSHKTR